MGFSRERNLVEGFSPGPAPGDDNPQWPGAPEEGKTYFECPMCEQESTLSYRCSECGYDGVDT